MRHPQFGAFFPTRPLAQMVQHHLCDCESKLVCISRRTSLVFPPMFPVLITGTRSTRALAAQVERSSLRIVHVTTTGAVLRQMASYHSGHNACQKRGHVVVDDYNNVRILRSNQPCKRQYEGGYRFCDTTPNSLSPPGVLGAPRSTACILPISAWASHTPSAWTMIT